MSVIKYCNINLYAVLKLISKNSFKPLGIAKILEWYKMLSMPHHCSFVFNTTVKARAGVSSSHGRMVKNASSIFQYDAKPNAKTQFDHHLF